MKALKTVDKFIGPWYKIFRKFAELCKKYYGQHYWSRGYAVTRSVWMKRR